MGPLRGCSHIRHGPEESARSLWQLAARGPTVSIWVRRVHTNGMGMPLSPVLCAAHLIYSPKVIERLTGRLAALDRPGRFWL